MYTEAKKQTTTMSEIFKERWLPVPIEGFEKSYEVSNLGQVRRLRFRATNIRGARCEYVTAILSPSCSRPKLTVTLLCGKVKKTVNVCGLVAKAFVPNPEGHPHVIFIDGDDTNVSAENLEWSSKRSYRSRKQEKKEKQAREENEEAAALLPHTCGNKKCDSFGEPIYQTTGGKYRCFVCGKYED